MNLYIEIISKSIIFIANYNMPLVIVLKKKNNPKIRIPQHTKMTERVSANDLRRRVSLFRGNLIGLLFRADDPALIPTKTRTPK